MENGNGENLFEVKSGETFVYPEGDAVLPDVQTFAADDTDSILDVMDVMRAEIERGARLSLPNGHHDSARDELEFDETDLLPDFYPRERAAGDFAKLTEVDDDHPLFMPASLQIGIETDEFLDG